METKDPSGKNIFLSSNTPQQFWADIAGDDRFSMKQSALFNPIVFATLTSALPQFVDVLSGVSF